MSTHGVPRTSDIASSLTRQRLPLHVTTAAQAAARDHAAIAGGVSSFGLMLAAGTRSAEVILRDYQRALFQGVAVYAGLGNNGGDAYIVAAQLARAGVRVRVVQAGPPRTVDAQRAAAFVGDSRGGRLTLEQPTGRELVIVDGLLGTGHRDALREPVFSLVAQMAEHRARGAFVVALDVPSGLDASTGTIAAGAVPAHVTVTYGTIKRGLLLARAHAGRIVLADIGLGEYGRLDDGAWLAADDRSLGRSMPAVPWNAHKGQRGLLEIVGGSAGMAGAVTLAARAALASGIGLARVCVERASVAPLQQAVPQAITQSWRTHDDPLGRDPLSRTPVRPPTALAIGPGLGITDAARVAMRAALDAFPNVPVVLDADALNLLAAEPGDAAVRMRLWCGDQREIVCTPHVREFARLTGVAESASWSERETALSDFAERAQTVVVLKGAPTLIAAAQHSVATGSTVTVTVVPRGTALLATGGSGDLLTGIIGALLAQGVDAGAAALVGASAHGGAAEVATPLGGGIRGLTLDHVLAALPQAWRELEHGSPGADGQHGSHLPPGVLAELPAAFA